MTLDNGDVITLSKAVKSGSSKAVTVGIRPEHLTVMKSRSKAAASVTMNVDMIEQLGADTLVHGMLDGSDTTLTARLSGVQSFARDTKVMLGFELENIHLFDAKHGKRLD
jgi:sn-glycerol 3-phosphate transport system ATP-binding protein